MNRVNLLFARSGNNRKSNHLGLSYLAGVLDVHNIKTRIIDAQVYDYSDGEIVNMVKEERPDLIGFSIFFNNFLNSINLINLLRREGFSGHITLGGHNPSFNYEKILKNFRDIDSVVIGEGEYTLSELAQKVIDKADWRSVRGIAYRENENIVKTSPRPLISDLDSLPFSYREEYKEYFRKGPEVNVSSSRGCFGRCSYCTISAFYELSPGMRWRCHSPVHVVDELELLLSEYGVRNFYFVDDNFIGQTEESRERLYEFGQELRKRKLKILFGILCRPDNIDKDIIGFLKENGLKRIDIGVESVVERQLKLYNKNLDYRTIEHAMEFLKETDIESVIYMIPFDPFIKRDELLENLKFIEKYKKQELENIECLNEITPYKGTAIREFFIKEGLIEKNDEPFGSDEMMDIGKMGTETQFIYEVKRAVDKNYNQLCENNLTFINTYCSDPLKKIFMRKKIGELIKLEYFELLKFIIENFNKDRKEEAKELIEKKYHLLKSFLEEVMNRLKDEKAGADMSITFRTEDREIVYDKEELKRALGKELLKSYEFLL